MFERKYYHTESSYVYLENTYTLVNNFNSLCFDQHSYGIYFTCCLVFNMC